MLVNFDFILVIFSCDLVAVSIGITWERNVILEGKGVTTIVFEKALPSCDPLCIVRWSANILKDKYFLKKKEIKRLQVTAF